MWPMWLSFLLFFYFIYYFCFILFYFILFYYKFSNSYIWAFSLHEETGCHLFGMRITRIFEKGKWQRFLWNKEKTRKERLWYGRSSRRDVLMENFLRGDTGYKRRLTGYLERR